MIINTYSLIPPSLVHFSIGLECTNPVHSFPSFLPRKLLLVLMTQLKKPISTIPSWLPQAEFSFLLLCKTFPSCGISVTCLWAFFLLKLDGHVPFFQCCSFFAG